MNAAWWTALGVSSRSVDDFDSATITQNQNMGAASNPLWDHYLVDDVTCVQRSFHYGGGHNKWDGGFFYMENNDTGATVDAGDTVVVSGDILSWNPSGDVIIEKFSDGKPVAIYMNSSHNGIEIELVLTSTPPGTSSYYSNFTIWHYSPWAWFGVPAEMIPSMLMQLGVDQDYIDSDAFDNAYDGQKSDYGGGATDPDLDAYRLIGEPIVETIKRMARHFYDPIYFNMKGQLAMGSRSRPDTVTAPYGIKDASWGITRDHICNIVRFTYGDVSRIKQVPRDYGPTTFSGYDVVADPNYDMECSHVPTAGVMLGSAYVVEDSVSVSIQEFGEIPIGGSDQVIVDGDAVRTAPTTHFPYFSERDDLAIYAARVDNESDEMREIVMSQDFRGIDYDLGYKVGNLQITGDGQTVSDCRCIEKTLNFSTFTVESVLLEAL